MLYRCACFTLDPERSLLVAGVEPVAIAPKAVDLLAVLVRNAGGVAAKSQLMDALWPHGFVEESNLTQHVYVLRRTFDRYGFPDAIQTLPRRGYRFTIPLRSENENAQPVRQRLNRRVVAALLALLALIASPQHRAAPLSATDRRTYELGRYFWSMRTPPALHRSIAYFARVVRDEPHSALGYSGLADAYLGLFDYECDGAPCSRYARLAEENARKAVAVDPESAPARTSLGMTLRVFDENYARSDDEFRRAIALDPQYALAHEWYGNSLLLRARIAEARHELETAATLQPIAPATYGWLARAEYYSHRFDRAIVYAREALALAPARTETRLVLGLSYEALGKSGRARAVFGGLSDSAALIAGVDARSGAKEEARALLSRASGDDADAALDCLALRDYTGALAHLRRVRFKDELNRRFFALDPRLDAVRGDTRFAAWTSVNG